MKAQEMTLVAMGEKLGVVPIGPNRRLRSVSPRRASVSALLGVAIVGILCGCGASPRHPATFASASDGSQRWATPTELRWLKRVGPYLGRFADQIGADPTVQTARRCQTLLRREVGTPPTARLRPSYTSISAACRDLVRYFKHPGGRQGNKVHELINRAIDEGMVGSKRTLPSFRGERGDVSHTDPLFAAAASAVADKGVSVRCWSASDWQHLLAESAALTHTSFSDVVGFAAPGGDVVNLSPGICSDLNITVKSGSAMADGQFGYSLGFAVTALAHEAEHARGVESEQRTQCYALQMIPSVAEQLGLTATAARRLADTVWTAYQQKRLVYWSTECKPGGPFDLHLHDPRWP